MSQQTPHGSEFSTFRVAKLQSFAPEDRLSVATKMLQAAGDLLAMPHNAAEVLEKLSNPCTLPRDIHDLIVKDQVLAARVLKVANSPYYGATRSISSMKDAILFMGFDSIKSVVLAAVLKGVFAEMGLAGSLLWEHSIGCGLVAKKLATACRYANNEEAFLAGLLHDIGKVVLFQRIPEKVSAIMQEVYNGDVDSASAEMQALGFTHAEVGQLLANKWYFTVNMEIAIANHHHPEDSKIAIEFSHLICLANAFCHKLEIGPTKRPNIDLSAHDSAKSLAMNSDQISQLIDELETTTKAGTDI
ncbi:MAG: HDOD domain-containing protein [Syntrophobacteraceae bacterium]